MLFITLGMYAQPRMFDFSQYVKVDSLPLEMVYFHSDKELNGDSVIELGDGYYMAKTPFKGNLTIKTNSDRTMAIVMNRFHFDPFQYTIKEDERRIILYFKDKHVYRGYVYDKKLKAFQFYDSLKGYKKFMRRHNRFIRRNPNK
jgi:hypothetical protein